LASPSAWRGRNLGGDPGRDDDRAVAIGMNEIATGGVKAGDIHLTAEFDDMKMRV